MAKLSSYYTLSPLIDQQNLLGVEKDSGSGTALVTLGKNIVIRYELKDVKQVSSWSTKERLTSKVIYDGITKKYAAIFNEKYIRVWSGEETELDKVKKNKFSLPLRSILTLEGFSPVVLLQNGNTASLEWALKNRQNWPCKEILKPKESLIKSQLINVKNKTYICTLSKVDDVYNHTLMPLEEKTHFGKVDQIKRIKIERESETLVGHVVMQDENDAFLLTLWSDGRLYSYSLISSSSESSPGELFSMITSVNTKHPVVMLSLNETTIAMYGADMLEEGAVLTIYNVQFKLVQAIQKLKLYTNDAKLWRVEDKLLLAANQHLAVAPFRLAPQRMEALLGSSLVDNKKDPECDIEVTLSEWQDESLTPFRISGGGLGKSIKKQVLNLTNEGLSNTEIPQRIISQLLESKDMASIAWCLGNFKNIPEKLLVDLLSFSFETNQPKKPMQNGDVGKKRLKSITFDQDEFLDKLFGVSYTDIYLLTHLKSSLTFDQVLRLFQHLVDRLDRHEKLEQHLYEWTSLLLDSHYQDFLLVRDPEALKHLEKLDAVLADHFQLLKDLENLRPMLVRLIQGKPLKPAKQDFNKFYSIEEVKLY